MWFEGHWWNSRSAFLACTLAVALPSLALLTLGDSGCRAPLGVLADPGGAPPARNGSTSSAAAAAAAVDVEALQAVGDDGSGPVIAACAGVEGTGHHMFHNGLFPALARALDDVYSDQGMVVRPKKGDKHVDGYASQLDHYATRHGNDFLQYHPARRANISAGRLQSIARALPHMRVLLVDAPSFPSCTLDLMDQHCQTKSSWNNPDFLALERGAMEASPPWRPRTIVLVRAWPDLLASTLDRGITAGGLPLELRYQANMLHMAMIALNAQVAALTTPWVVLEYERMVKKPGGCGRGLASFLGLPGDVGERVASKVVRAPSSHAEKKWSSEELRWIRETFESEDAARLWPVIHRGRRERAIC